MVMRVFLGVGQELLELPPVPNKEVLELGAVQFHIVVVDPEWYTLSKSACRPMCWRASFHSLVSSAYDLVGGRRQTFEGLLTLSIATDL